MSGPNPLAPLPSSFGHSEESFSRSRDRSGYSQQNSKNDEAGQYERMQDHAQARKPIVRIAGNARTKRSAHTTAAKDGEERCHVASC